MRIIKKINRIKRLVCLDKLIKFLNDKEINLKHNLEPIHLFQNLKSEQIDFLINTELKKNREVIEKLLHQFDNTTESFEKIEEKNGYDIPLSVLKDISGRVYLIVVDGTIKKIGREEIG